MKAKSTPPQKAEPGVIILILVAIILTVIGLYLEDARRVPYNTFGGIVWFTVFIVSFLFGLLFFAQFVLPLRGNEGWSEGLRLLWRHYTTLGQQYLDTLFGPKPAPQFKSRRRRQNVPKSNHLGLPASFTKLKAGILKSHQVLALVKGSQFIRPAGPGFVMLFKKENVAHLIDLRKHLRRQLVKVITRDGIPLETTVTVIFHVQQEPADLLGTEPYPYDNEAIFHISYSLSIDEKDAVRGWMEQISPRAAALLVSEISHFTLDELYRSASGGIGPLGQIKTRVKQQLERQLDSNGIEILLIGIDPFSLPDTVIAQRIKTWRADWERKIMLQQAASDAETVRRIKRARARAQIEIIENITQNIASMRRAGNIDLSHVITLRMIEALEEAQSNASLQGLMPQHVMSSLVRDTSKQMQVWLDRPEELES